MDEVEKLIKQLKDPYARRAAVNALVKFGEVVVEPLIEKLGDENPDVRGGIAEVLGNIGDVRAIEPLIGMLDDRVSYSQREAILALGRIGKPAVLSLIAKLGERDYNVQYGAARALGRIGKPAVLSLIAKLDDESSTVRLGAILALGKIGDARAVGPLIKMLGDEASLVRGELGAAGALVELAPEADIDLSKVAESLKEYVDSVGKKGDAVETDLAAKWAVKTYKKIADSVAKKKQAEMGGVLLPARIPKPKGKGKIYRMRRVV